MSKQASDFKGMVILSAFLAPVLGGAILYYSLKKSHEKMAKLGNNMSWLAVVIWIVVSMALGKSSVFAPEIIQFIMFIIGIVGIVLSIITVVKIKKTPS